MINLRSFTPKVSIIIPVYNGSNYLSEAIDSALAQSYKNVEVIVVNDGSNDDNKTEAIAKSYGESIKYYSKENGGVATALNYGIQKMTGEYFSWLSHDDVYYENKIEIQIGYLETASNKKTVLFGGWDIINESSQIIGQRRLDIGESPDFLNKGLYSLLNGYINGCTLLIHKSCFTVVGLFDASLRTTQDYALWFKLLRKYPALFHQEILLKSRSHPEQGSFKETVHLQEANDLWVSFIENINESDISEIYGSLSGFYYTMAMRLEGSYVPGACLRAVNKLQAISYKTKVSVILPTYNRGWCIKQAIDSVLRQTFDQYELIIIDDGSNDDTREVVEKYEEERLLYFYQQNKGVAAARNFGLLKASGEYIAFIDSDDIWTPDHLEKHITLLDQNLNFAMTYNLAKFINPDGEESGEYAIDVDLDMKIYPAMLFIKNNIITTPSVVIRKAALDTVGYFDETLDMCEDLDLWRRIARRYSVKRISEFLTYVKMRNNQFDPDLYFVKRKQYIEKAIQEDNNISEPIILELYNELYKVYYMAGCNYEPILNDLIILSAKHDKIKDLLKKHLLNIVVDKEWPIGTGEILTNGTVAESSFILSIKENLKKFGVVRSSLKPIKRVINYLERL